MLLDSDSAKFDSKGPDKSITKDCSEAFPIFVFLPLITAANIIGALEVFLKIATLICFMTFIHSAQAAITTKETTPINKNILTDEISDDDVFEDDVVEHEEFLISEEDVQFLNTDENKLLAYANILKRQAKAEIYLFGSVQNEIIEELEYINEDIEYDEADEEFLKARFDLAPSVPQLEAKASLAPTKTNK